MRIAWITTGFSKDENDYSGAAAIHNLARELSLSKEIDLTIFSLYYPVNKSEYKFYDAKVFSFAQSTKTSKLEKMRLWKRCRRKFEEEHWKNKFDLIHSMWAGESGYIASRLSRKLNIPFIANICGGELAEIPKIKYGSRMKFWQKTFVNMAFEAADKIIAGSAYIIDKIGVYYDETIQKKVLKIPFGVDENLFFPNKQKSQRPFPILITIGSAVDVKGYTFMLHAVDRIRKKYPDLMLVICGRDDKGKLRNIVNKLELNDNVAIKGFVDFEKIPIELNEADIFVLSSSYESQNMSLIEAAFCGLPVVSTRVGVAEKITNNLVNPGDAEQLADKLLEVINNYVDEHEKAGSKISELKEKFSLSKSVNRFVELYKSLSV
jgi:glycosyltransferase involved in cell wall biosynthesis